MNCPCSGVYVCAYIVIFLPWPANKKKILGQSTAPFLCVLADSYLCSKAKKKKKKSTVYISRTQQIQTSRQTTAFQFTFSFKTCEFKEKNDLNNPTDKKVKLATGQCFKRAASVYVRTKGNISKSLFARLWLKCIWAAVAQHEMATGLASSALAFPRQPTQTSALPPHHHFAQHQTTELACSAAPVANPKN